MSSIVSQSIITRRIIGKRMHSLGATISAELETFNSSMFRKYRVRCGDYNVYLYIYENGRVHAELWTYERTVVIACTLAGFISLLKNCKRWATEQDKPVYVCDHCGREYFEGEAKCTSDDCNGGK